MSKVVDHRQIAGEMDLYFLNENIGAGLPVWLPNGVIIRDSLEAFIKELERRAGYHRVVSPHLARPALYEKSGHLKFYSEDMFPKISNEEDPVGFYLKPMNCPHHHLAFSAKPRSYKQLPLRLAEYGQVYRFEPSGALRGLSRVRGFCQNDAHIYIHPDQALEEIRSVLKLHVKCYKLLGLDDIKYRLSLRDENDGEFIGESNLWESCENILRNALRLEGVPFEEAKGEAAFYGPKIDVQMMIGHLEESIGSIQLDAVSGERFDLSFVDRDGMGKRPWIVHRAPLGAHERFVAALLEKFEGQLPAWLCPVQLALIPVNEAEHSYCRELAENFRPRGLRVHVEDSLGSLAKRIKSARLLRPFARVVVGPEEVRIGNLKVDYRNSSFEGNVEQAVEDLNFKCRMPIE